MSPSNRDRREARRRKRPKNHSLLSKMGLQRRTQVAAGWLGRGQPRGAPNPAPRHPRPREFATSWSLCLRSHARHHPGGDRACPRTGRRSPGTPELYRWKRRWPPRYSSSSPCGDEARDPTHRANPASPGPASKLLGGDGRARAIMFAMPGVARAIRIDTPAVVGDEDAHAGRTCPRPDTSTLTVAAVAWGMAGNVGQAPRARWRRRRRTGRVGHRTRR